MNRKGRSKIIVPFLLPALLIYLIFFIYPTLQALWVSLHTWTGFQVEMDFVGFENFKNVFKDPVFLLALKNTLIIAIVGGVFIVGGGLILAGILNRPNLKLKRTFRTIIFFPNVVPAVGLGVLWIFLLNDGFGLFNGILQAIGLGDFARTWLDTDWAFKSVMVAIIWTYIGFYMVVLQSGLKKIPDSFYDAAKVEGAGYWKRFLKISVPLVREILIIAVVLWFIGAMKQFDLVYAMTEGGPSNSTQTISVYLYQTAFGERSPVYQMGYGTAMAAVLLVIVVIGVTFTQLFNRKERIEF